MITTAWLMIMSECIRVGVPPLQFFLISFAKIQWVALETSGRVVTPQTSSGLTPGYGAAQCNV